MNFLIRSLRGNGLFSITSGLAAIVFAGPLSERMTVPVPAVLIVGLGVLAFGISIVWSTRKSTVDPLFALAVIVSDLIWVVVALVVIVIPGILTAKWILGLVTTVVGLFALLQILGLVRLTSQDPKRLETEIEIDAAPELVWSVITDLASYSDWNPFIVDAHGDATVGGRVDVEMRPEGGKAIRFAPTVTEATAPSEFEWLGHLGPRGLFDGRHRFELVPTEAGTRLRHSEEFTGLLVPLLAKSLDAGTLDGFRAMNEAMKRRIETSSHN